MGNVKQRTQDQIDSVNAIKLIFLKHLATVDMQCIQANQQIGDFSGLDTVEIRSFLEIQKMLIEFGEEEWVSDKLKL